MKVLNRYDHKDRVRPKRDFTIKRDKNKNILNPEVVSRTKQSERDASDINTIVAKARKTGVLGSGLPAQRQAQYGDFRNAGDFMEQQNRVVAFKEMFDALPAETRDMFKNNPANLLEFVNDPENREEAQELGLLPKDVLTRDIVDNNLVVYKNGKEMSRRPLTEAEQQAVKVKPAPEAKAPSQAPEAEKPEPKA